MGRVGARAGVIAAGRCRAVPLRQRASFDMGGTTAKVGLIQDGRAALSTEMEVGAQAVTPLGEAGGGGYPVRTRWIDLVEVGRGRGTRRGSTRSGALRVGRAARGARPGRRATAWAGRRRHHRRDLALGRLRPGVLPRGRMALDADAGPPGVASAWPAVGLDPLGPASRHRGDRQRPHDRRHRLVRCQRGYDPATSCWWPSGAPGPLHANALQRELSIPTVLVPPSPGIASALGNARDRHPPRVRGPPGGAPGRGSRPPRSRRSRRLRGGKGRRGSSATGAARGAAHAAEAQISATTASRSSCR